MVFDSAAMLAAMALFGAAIAAWRLAAPFRASFRLYLRFAAVLCAALAVTAAVHLADIAALFLLPLAAASLALAALARFARPLPAAAAAVALVAALAGGLGALVTGYPMLALAPLVVAALAIIAASLNGMAAIPILSGIALLAGALAALEQGIGAGVLLFCAAALLGLTRRSAFAVHQQGAVRRGGAIGGVH